LAGRRRHSRSRRGRSMQATPEIFYPMAEMPDFVSSAVSRSSISARMIMCHQDELVAAHNDPRRANTIPQLN